MDGAVCSGLMFLWLIFTTWTRRGSKVLEVQMRLSRWVWGFAMGFEVKYLEASKQRKYVKALFYVVLRVVFTILSMAVWWPYILFLKTWLMYCIVLW